jgi:hypothetical protein
MTNTISITDTKILEFEFSIDENQMCIDSEYCALLEKGYELAKKQVYTKGTYYSYHNECKVEKRAEEYARANVTLYTKEQRELYYEFHSALNDFVKTLPSDKVDRTPPKSDVKILNFSFRGVKFQRITSWCPPYNFGQSGGFDVEIIPAI